MPVWNFRAQLPVGQGGFHVAAVGTDTEQPVLYVYDCGSLTSNACDTQSMLVCEALQYCDSQPQIYVFFSHLDKDHVSGAKALLEGIKNRSKRRVTAVFLPYLTPHQRLLWSMDAAFDGTLVGEELSSLLSVITSPVQQLGEFGAERVILVRGRPGTEEPGEAFLPDIPVSVDGSGYTEAGGGSPRFSELPGGTRLRLGKIANALNFALVPFVPERKPEQTAEFEQVLDTTLQSLGSSVADITPSGLLTMLGNELSRTQLRATYEVLARDHNRCSLLLYAGPMTPPKFIHIATTDWLRNPGPPFRLHHMWREHWWHWCDFVHSRVWDAPWNPPSFANNGNRIGWLGTGDACLTPKSDLGAVRAEYKQFGQMLRTVQGPHHGSEASSSPEFYQWAQPLFVVYSASTTNSYGHPRANALKHAAQSGATLVQVSEAGPAFVEVCWWEG